MIKGPTGKINVRGNTVTANTGQWLKGGKAVSGPSGDINVGGKGENVITGIHATQGASGEIKEKTGDIDVGEAVNTLTGVDHS